MDSSTTLESYTTYQVLKDFAGPAAAIFGAAVAGFITFVISRGQRHIAQSQRDIALDQLKFNLLQRRYEIYQATKELLEYVSFITDISKSDSVKIRALSVKMDESRFYFPTDITNFLHETRARCEVFLTRLGQRENINTDDAEQWSATADALAKDQTALRMIYEALPEVFEKTLAFRQLTTDK
ncbi:MAG: hypothetical protein WA728_31100 [Xanthobacteraceae bacterium]